jgi:hypothetical protein
MKDPFSLLFFCIDGTVNTPSNLSPLTSHLI